MGGFQCIMLFVLGSIDMFSCCACCCLCASCVPHEFHFVIFLCRSNCILERAGRLVIVQQVSRIGSNFFVRIWCPWPIPATMM
jgi:hypothetical protein